MKQPQLLTAQDGQKECSKCGRVLSLDNFYYSDRRFLSSCKSCSRERSRTYRQTLRNKRALAMKRAVGPGVISLKEAAAICREGAGVKVSTSFLYGKIMRQFRHLGDYDIDETGRRKFKGVIESRLLGLIRGRPWAKTETQLFGEGL